MQINKENSITVLTNSVRLGQKMGAYLMREAKLLKQAIDYFNPDVKDKPDFGGSTSDPEIVAINLLLQGVQKAQSHGGELAFSLDDAALLSDIMEWWVKMSNSDITKTAASASKEGKSAKAAANGTKSVAAVQEGEDEEDEDLDDSIRPIKSFKGKSVSN